MIIHTFEFEFKRQVEIKILPKSSFPEYKELSTKPF